jgi:hypothetical protein
VASFLSSIHFFSESSQCISHLCSGVCASRHTVQKSVLHVWH